VGVCFKIQITLKVEPTRHYERTYSSHTTAVNVTRCMKLTENDDVINC